ncbi:Oxidoreductase molybdopterin binding domain-containing protein [Streptomyces sp. TLI_053]|uniref:molybdopterin-dependent oxidoreductase n=1 Tax=Streptomyces sp. TLI_053 TaxID=1855352 RepID=UPI00087C04FC|nr:molybdopterin-dependent oxidoreductase [Streptomyces sp. TLI_053]SDS83576.1 Oxidoreductase molybdopterin binding domain-containing protein [Streptomyces sp. TLI_053]
MIHRSARATRPARPARRVLLGPALVLALCATGCAASPGTPTGTGAPAGTVTSTGTGTSTGSVTSTGTGAASSAPAVPLKPGAVRVSGEVDKPYTLTLADLRRMPLASVTVTYTSAKGQQTHSFDGVPLHTVLSAAAPRFDTSKKNGALRGVVAATGGGDYRAVFGWAELDPGFAKSQVLVAVSQDGVPLDDNAGPSLVVPQDTKGGRYVSELDRLWVGTVDQVVDGGR